MSDAKKPRSLATTKRLRCVLARVNEEISGIAKGGGRFASALSSEGYAGGYRQAISDVLLAMESGALPNTRNYWEQT